MGFMMYKAKAASPQQLLVLLRSKFYPRLQIINKNQKQQAEMPNAFSDVYTYLAEAMLLTQIRHVEWNIHNISINSLYAPMTL